MGFFVEDQAVDRVYRLGQKRPVSVFRLVVRFPRYLPLPLSFTHTSLPLPKIRNTIEERVMQLQDKKRRLAHSAFGEKQVSGEKIREARMEDLRSLLGGAAGAGDGASSS